MLPFFANLLGRTASGSRPAPKQRLRPALESLEDRSLLAAGITQVGTQIQIEGSGVHDTAKVTYYDNGTDQVADDFVRVTLYGKNQQGSTVFSLTKDFSVFQVTSVRFKGYGGNDWFENDSNLISNAYGHSGYDTLLGGSSNDYLHGDEQNDYLYGGGGADALFGGSGNDTLDGGDGGDYLYGGIDNDTLKGGTGGGEDYLWGEAGNDLMYGGGYRSNMYGGDGNDLMYGTDNEDHMDGGAGGDWMHGFGGNDSMYGGDDNDILIGGTGQNWLYGEGGNDTLLSSAGAMDRLYGGAGTDFIITSPDINGLPDDIVHP